MKRNFYSRLIIALLLVFFLVSCAGRSLMGPDDTPELGQKKAFMVADKEIAQSLAKYNDYYAMASDEEKADWKKNIDPLFVAADKALDAWALAIIKDMDPLRQEQMYLDLKRELFIWLLQIGID